MEQDQRVAMMRGASGGSGIGRVKGSGSKNKKIVVSASFLLILMIGIVVTLSVVTNIYHSTQIVDNTSMNQSRPNSPHHQLSTSSSHRLRRGRNADSSENAVAAAEDDIEELRRRVPPSFWTIANTGADPAVAELVKDQLTDAEYQKSIHLCGAFLYSSLKKATHVTDQGETTFVATGDIDDMWTRDSAVQMGIYMARLSTQPWLRLIVEGAIRRQAFNTVQDPYGNAYERSWKDPAKLALRDRVIGRGGWVATRNYELDSGAYYLTQLYDYYVAAGNVYRRAALLQEPMIFDAVMLMVDTWIVEQYHDAKSPYRYFELPNQGKGAATAYTGMTWTGFRPSDDPCKYGYLVPSNIHAAAGLERVLALNERVWHSAALETKARRLLHDIEDGIAKHGVVTTSDGARVYAYEVDGLGNALADFDDANVPSLLSIPLLGWSKYDPAIYATTRARLLSPKTNKYYFEGKQLRGMGSPHTPHSYVWSMAFTIEALTLAPPSAPSQSTSTMSAASKQAIADNMAFQIRQSLTSACSDVMHESVHVNKGCPQVTRHWFEWANAMFVVLVEASLGERCDASGQAQFLQQQSSAASSGGGTTTRKNFYVDPHHNNHQQPEFYQGIQATVPHHE